MHTSSLDIASMSACDDHPVLNLEPRLGLLGGVGEEVRQKEDLLGNEIEGIERKNVMCAAKALDEAAEDDGMRVPCGICR